MSIKRRVILSIFAILIALFVTIELYSKVPDFKLIKIEKVSRLFEDRIAFQHIQLNNSPKNDDSMANLLIIQNKQVYLLSDGYDDAKEVEMKRYVKELQRSVYESLWKNKINSKPDYIKITERRVERLLNVTEEFVNKNFGDFYNNVRNAFISKHVKIFRQLMVFSALWPVVNRESLKQFPETLAHLILMHLVSKNYLI